MNVLWLLIAIGFWRIIAFYLSQLFERPILLPVDMRDMREERETENINKERWMNKQTKYWFETKQGKGSRESSKLSRRQIERPKESGIF